MHQRIAIDLGGRGEQKPRLFRHRQTQRLVRAERADLERLDRELEVIDRARGAREVQHAVEGAVDRDEGRDVLAVELEVGIVGDVGEVGGIAGELVVHPEDPVSRGQEAVNEMRSEESGRPRYEDAHPSGRPMLS